MVDVGDAVLALAGCRLPETVEVPPTGGHQRLDGRLYVYEDAKNGDFPHSCPAFPDPATAKSPDVESPDTVCQARFKRSKLTNKIAIFSPLFTLFFN